MIEPDYSRWDCPIHSYPSLEAFFDHRQIENGIHSISINGHLLDFFFKGKPCENLMVVFGGAARRSDGAPPFFSGIRLFDHVNCSLMAINDPSLYLDRQINLAWYTGSRVLPLQSILPAVIDRVTLLRASRTIMTGGSGGGFASLYYSTRTSQPATVVAYNPQTNICNYYRPELERFARVCFGWTKGSIQSAIGDITYDLCRHYMQEKAPTILLQNSADYPSIMIHTIPFLKAWGLDWTGKDLATDNLYLHVGYWGSGHMAPPRETIAHVINQLCRTNAVSIVGDLTQQFSQSIPFVVDLAQPFLRQFAFAVGPAQRYSNRSQFVVSLARIAISMARSARSTVQGFINQHRCRRSATF
ncbi:MAG: hypothetical protein WC169_07015 [Dehalococcoidia bacterium]